MTLVKFNRPASGLERTWGLPSIFDEFFNPVLTGQENNWLPAVNIKETPDSYKIELAVPGIEKNNLKIEVENDLLTVSGERKEERNEKENIARKEFYYGSFSRSFTLPETADTEKVMANYKDGVLTVVVSKREEAKAKPKREIKVS